MRQRQKSVQNQVEQGLISQAWVYYRDANYRQTLIETSEQFNQQHNWSTESRNYV
jgi:hypothetical protein